MGKKRLKIRKRSKHEGNKVQNTLIAILILTMIAGIAYGTTSILKSVGLIGNDQQNEQEVFKSSPPIDGKIPILLIGVDTRTESKTGSRSDTIMVAFIDLKNSTVDLLSIPRDTKAEIPGHGTQKLNHSHAYGGPELLMETVNNLLDLKMAYYVEVDFSGFKDVVDALGGVELTVGERMYYPAENIDLQPGFQKLNGYDALAYARYRYDAKGDLGRAERQQELIKLLAKKSLATRNVFTAANLAKATSKMIDTNLTTTQLLYMANKMKDTNVDAMGMNVAPGEPSMEDGIWYYLLDTEGTQEIINGYMNPPTENTDGAVEEDSAEE